MAKPYSDDLRRRIVQAYAQREGTQAQLAQRFRVRLGYVEKVRGQAIGSGKMERVPHRSGRKPKFTEPIREALRDGLGQQPDLTWAELQEKLVQAKPLRVSVPSLWVVLGQMGLRLKKSRSTRGNGTRKSTASGGRRFWKRSAPSRRKGWCFWTKAE